MELSATYHGLPQWMEKHDKKLIGPSVRVAVDCFRGCLPTVLVTTENVSVQEMPLKW